MKHEAVERRILEALPGLPPAERRVARALLADYPALGLGPVADLASRAGAGAATVVRLVARLGFDGYPDFQRRLRAELAERSKTPLDKTAPEPGPGEDFLSRFAAHVAFNIEATARAAPPSEFEAACQLLATARGGVHVTGGRFTEAIGHWLVAHLRILRPGVRQLNAGAAARRDQLLDARPRDVAVLFDVRRYDADLAEVAAELAQKKVQTVLVTDEWVSPAARHARVVLPCRIDVGRTWDAGAALLVMAEAMLARVSEIGWRTAAPRIASIENRGQSDGRTDANGMKR